jgi:hypothetical protein
VIDDPEGGSNTGRTAFDRYLVNQFNSLYASGPCLWQLAPSHRTAATYLDLYAVDTAYHGAKPQITGPGLHGHPFYAHGCTA